MSDDWPRDPDNPEWTREDFVRARPAAELLPREIAGALVRQDMPSRLLTEVRRQNRLARGWSLAA